MAHVSVYELMWKAEDTYIDTCGFGSLEDKSRLSDEELAIMSAENIAFMKIIGEGLERDVPIPFYITPLVEKEMSNGNANKFTKKEIETRHALVRKFRRAGRIRNIETECPEVYWGIIQENEELRKQYGLSPTDYNVGASAITSIRNSHEPVNVISKDVPALIAIREMAYRAGVRDSLKLFFRDGPDLLYLFK